MATNTGDLYVNIKADIRELQKGLNQATKEIKSFGGKMDKSTKQNEGFFKSFSKGRNDIVRLVRQLETLAVAGFAVHASYKLIIGAGLELNKQYQDQSLGIAALISSKTKMIGMNGKELSSYESFLATQATTKGVMDDIKKASLDTPASFQQMVGFYQQAIGHAISANGTFGKSIEDVNKNVITMTQGMSALGSSMGMEMTKVNEEIRSLMSGNASTDSLLALVLFGSPTAANEAVRNAKKKTEGLSNLILNALEPFKNVQEVMTYSKAVARLSATFDEMQKGMTSELFDDLTYAFVDLKEELDSGLDEFIQSWTDVYNEAKAFFDITLGALSDMGSSMFGIVGYIWDMTGGFDAFKILAIGIATVIQSMAKVIAGAANVILKTKQVAWQVAKELGIGDYADDAAWSARDKNTLDRLERAASSGNAQAQKDYDTMKKRLDDKYNAETKIHKENIAKQEKELQDTIDKSYKDMMKPIDVNDLSKKYDATKNANSFIAGIRDSYKGAQDLDSAMASIASSTQAAVDAANGDEKILKRIGTEAQKAMKYAQGEFLARNATTKLLGNAVEEDKKKSKELEKQKKELDAIYRKYLELTGQDLKLFELDADKTMGDMMKLYNLGMITAEDVGKAYDGMWKEYVEKGEKANEKVALDFTKQFEGLFQGIFDGDLGDAVKGLFDGIAMEAMAEPIKEISKSLSGSVKGLFSGLGSFGTILGGIGLSAVGSLITSLFNDTMTQAEIDAAKGRIEFDDDSLRSLESVFADAQYPMLEVTNKTFKHIRNMDANFYSVARALSTKASAGGVDLTGVNFVDTYSEGFLGFSSKSVSLLSSGLKFELQTLGAAMDSLRLGVKAYTTTLVEESSWFGLSSDTSVEKTFKNLPKDVVKDIAATFAEGYEAILLAGVNLGLDETNLSTLLKSSKLKIGEVDFTGLSQQEVSDRLSQTFSTALSGVITGIADFTYLVERYAKNSEYALETLIRISTEYDQARFSFELIGKTFTDGIINVTKSWTEETLVSTNGLFSWWGNTINGFGNSFSTTVGLGLNSIFGGLFGTTKTVTTYFTETVQEVYTAQMQILDIVESAGGLQSFQDAMQSFMSNFYSEGEQLVFMQKALAASFSTLGIEVPQTKEAFRELLETMDTSTEAGAYLYGQVLLLAESFAAMSDASENLRGSMSSAIKDIADAWLGSLSYLTIQQKADFASGYFKIARESNGVIDTVEAARLTAETALKSVGTKEEYIPIFNRYIGELENKVADATLDTVVDRLDTLIKEIIISRQSATNDKIFGAIA